MLKTYRLKEGTCYLVPDKPNIVNKFNMLLNSQILSVENVGSSVAILNLIIVNRKMVEDPQGRNTDLQFPACFLVKC